MLLEVGDNAVSAQGDKAFWNRFAGGRTDEVVEDGICVVPTHSAVGPPNGWGTRQLPNGWGTRRKQIPFANDRKKGKNKSKGLYK